MLYDVSIHFHSNQLLTVTIATKRVPGFTVLLALGLVSCVLGSFSAYVYRKPSEIKIVA